MESCLGNVRERPSLVFLWPRTARLRTLNATMGAPAAAAAAAAAALVHITVVLDFMCPWSFIGLRSLALGMQSAGPAVAYNITLLPYEFDAPGTYGTMGVDWEAYCKSYEPATAKYLLEQKLPRAFELGRQVGIAFKMERRIVGTEGVNAALMVAQSHSQEAGLDFALTMLSRHFEDLQDPNDPETLAEVLSGLGVPTPSWIVAGTGASVLSASQQRTDSNAALTLRGRELSGGSVPRFSVRCGDDDRDWIGSGGGATSPKYFEKLIGKCLSIEQQREMQTRHGSCTETYDGDAEGLGKCLAGLGE